MHTNLFSLNRDCTVCTSKKLCFLSTWMIFSCISMYFSSLSSNDLIRFSSLTIDLKFSVYSRLFFQVYILTYHQRIQS